jgi:hypothetical protein
MLQRLTYIHTRRYYCITACTKGFFANRSDAQKFDPSAEPTGPLSFTMIGLLQNLYPTLKRAYPKIIAAHTTRDPLESMPRQNTATAWCAMPEPHSSDPVRWDLSGLCLCVCMCVCVPHTHTHTFVHTHTHTLTYVHTERRTATPLLMAWKWALPAGTGMRNGAPWGSCLQIHVETGKCMCIWMYVCVCVYMDTLIYAHNHETKFCCMQELNVCVCVSLYLCVHKCLLKMIFII